MITAYKTPQQYLDATAAFLEQREVENNLIWGVSNDFADKTQKPGSCVFINAFADDKIQATSIKTLAKAIVSGDTTDTACIQELADHYRQNNIALHGVVGESFYAHQFAKAYGGPHQLVMKLLCHKLTVVNSLPGTSGNFEMANENDIELIIEWSIQFDEDAHVNIKKTREERSADIQRKVATGNIIKWVHNGVMVSMAGMVRTTKNVGIVGLVYTPAEHRNKGYATSTVLKLSEHILQSGYKYCALFTDKTNPTSNHIYKKIGYDVVVEYADIQFG